MSPLCGLKRVWRPSQCHIYKNTHTEADREQEWDRDVGSDWLETKSHGGDLCICVAFRNRTHWPEIGRGVSPLKLHDIPESATARSLLTIGEREKQNRRYFHLLQHICQLSSVSVKCQKCGISFLCKTTFLLCRSQKCSTYSLHIRNNTAIRYLLPAMAVGLYLKDKKCNKITFFLMVLPVSKIRNVFSQ